MKKKITLEDFIIFIGISTAAKLFECSEHTVKAWRYGNRRPSIEQAKKIIKATDGKLDIWSIFGGLDD